MKRRFLAGFMLVVLFLPSVGIGASAGLDNAVPLNGGVYTNGGALTLNTPAVLYGERIEGSAPPWYKRKWGWAIIAALLGGAIWAASRDGDSDPSSSSFGALEVTGPQP